MQVVTLTNNENFLHFDRLLPISLSNKDMHNLRGTAAARKLDLVDLVRLSQSLHIANRDFLYRSLQVRKHPLDSTADFALCCFLRNGAVLDLFKRASSEDDIFTQMICTRLMIDTLCRIGLTTWMQTRVCTNVVFKNFLDTSGPLRTIEGDVLTDQILRDRFITARPLFSSIENMYDYASNAIHASGADFSSPLIHGDMIFVDTGDVEKDGKPFKARVLSFDYDLAPDDYKKQVIASFCVLSLEVLILCSRTIHEIPGANSRMDGLTRDDTHEVYIKASNDAISDMYNSGLLKSDKPWTPSASA